MPLALLLEPCSYHEAALAALARAGVDYQIALVRSSGAGLRAAAQADFAVTPVVQTQRVQGLHVVRPDAGLPSLPDVAFTIFAATSASAHIGDELANAIVLAFANKG